jgi:hypothetical protein
MNNFGGRWKYYRFRCGYTLANFHNGYESGLKDMTCVRKKRRALISVVRARCVRKMDCRHCVTTVIARTRTACRINIRGLLFLMPTNRLDLASVANRPSRQLRQADNALVKRLVDNPNVRSSLRYATSGR